MAKALGYIDHIDGDRVAVLGSAGGFGVIASDYIGSCDTYCAGMEMANISERGRQAIKRDVDYYASAENPIDLTGGATDLMFDESLEILQGEMEVDVILVLLQLQTPQVTSKLVDVVARWGNPEDKPLVVCCIGGWDTRPVTRRLEASCIPTYTSLRRAVWAIRALYNRGLYLRRVQKTGQHTRVLSEQPVQ
jgi:acyl-CoA synthetase (NDP forming)